MRARNIKPGFFKNAELAELPFEARILFQGLWCLADRRGRLEDRPKQIRGEVLPHDAIDVPPILDALQKLGFILRYEVKGNKYIQITNFEKHQYPNVKEKESTIPTPYKHRSSTEQKRLNPDVLNPESPTTGGVYKVPEETTSNVLVTDYKVALGIPVDDRSWDKVHFARCAKTAKLLVEVCGDVSKARQCLKDVSDELNKKNLSWTLETILKYASKWVHSNGNG